MHRFRTQAEPLHDARSERLHHDVYSWNDLLQNEGADLLVLQVERKLLAFLLLSLLLCADGRQVLYRYDSSPEVSEHL